MKRSFYLSNGVQRFFSLNKKVVFIVLSVMLICVLTGIFTSAKTCVHISVCLVQNVPLRLFLLNKLSLFGYIFLQLLFCFSLLFLVFFLSFFKIGSFFIFCILSYFCYALGVDLAIIFVSFSILKGIFVAVLGILPFKLFIFFLIFLYSIKLIRLNKSVGACGSSSVKAYEFKNMLSFFLVLSALIVLQSLVLFLITKIFVF